MQGVVDDVGEVEGMADAADEAAMHPDVGFRVRAVWERIQVGHRRQQHLHAYHSVLNICGCLCR